MRRSRTPRNISSYASFTEAILSTIGCPVATRMAQACSSVKDKWAEDSCGVRENRGYAYLSPIMDLSLEIYPAFGTTKKALRQLFSQAYSVTEQCRLCQ